MLKEAEQEKNAEKTVRILLQLDEKNLLIVDGAIRLLLARQNMDKTGEKEK